MALTDEDYTFLQQVHEQFADVELEPDDPRREPLHDDSRDDPVRQMLGAIRFSGSRASSCSRAFAAPAKPPNCSACGGSWKRPVRWSCTPTP